MCSVRRAVNCCSCQCLTNCHWLLLMKLSGAMQPPDAVKWCIIVVVSVVCACTACGQLLGVSRSPHGC